MYKILTAVAAVAIAALGTVIVATVLLRSSISGQSSKISALERAENTDHRQIAALEREVGAANKQKQLTAAGPRCAQLPQPMGEHGLVLAGPALLFATRQDSPTAWNALAVIRHASETSAPGHSR